MTLVPTLLACLLTSQTPAVQDPAWLTFQDDQKAVAAQFPGWESFRPYPGPILKGAYNRKGTSSFILVYCDLPKGTDPQTFLPKAYDDHVAGVKWARIVSREFGSWQGLPAYDGVFLVGSGTREATARIRLVVLGNRLFQQYAQCNTLAPEDKALADRFFDSLKLIR